MLHETRHVAQIQRLEASGALGGKELFAPRVRGAAERGAYEYELRLGKRFGFSDSYKTFLRDQIRQNYPRAFGDKFERSSTMRRILEVMEPRLDPRWDPSGD